MIKEEPDEIHILLVDSNAADAKNLIESLKELPPPAFSMTHVQSLSEAMERAEDEKFSAVLLDLDLPDSQGFDTLDAFVKRFTLLPVVVLSGLEDSDLAFQAVQRGAQDYLVKQRVNPFAIARVMRYAVERHNLLVELDSMRLLEIKRKDEFLSDVAHELRTPLTSIHHYVSALSEGAVGEATDEQCKVYDVLLKNVKQLKSMINDLLDLARNRSGSLRLEFQPTPVADLVRDILPVLTAEASKRELELTTEMDEDLADARGDPDRVKQIIANLVNNAIKFTPVEGRIVIRAVMDAGRVQVSVEDTGRGMTEETMSRMFDRHYQDREDSEVSRKGLGLGLAICKELVELHDGELSADSHVGEGTTMTFTLPIWSEGEQGTRGSCTAHGAGCVTGNQLMPLKKILIVDDDEDIRMSLSLRLKARGFDTLLAETGEMALNMLSSEKPDLILLDLIMPHGDGFGFLNAMDAVFPLSNIPVIVVTARDIRPIRSEIEASGVSAILQKPVEDEDLFKSIIAALRNPVRWPGKMLHQLVFTYARKDLLDGRTLRLDDDISGTKRMMLNMSVLYIVGGICMLTILNSIMGMILCTGAGLLMLLCPDVVLGASNRLAVNKEIRKNKLLLQHPFRVRIYFTEGVSIEHKSMKGLVPWSDVEGYAMSKSTILLIAGKNFVNVPRRIFLEQDAEDRFLRTIRQHTVPYSRHGTAEEGKWGASKRRRST